MVDLLLLLIPLAFVIYVVYKGLNPTFSMILAAILVCLVERMDVLACFLGSGVGPMAEPGLMLTGVTSAVTMFLLKFLAAMFFGTKTTAAFVPGMVGVAVILACDCIYIYSALKKAEKKDEHFVPGGVIKQEENAGEERLPNFFLSIIPLLIVAVMNMILGVDVVLALMAGALVAAITLCNFIATPQAKIKPYMDIVGQGITSGGIIFIPMAFQQGLATVIQATSGFAYLSNALTNLALNTSPYLSFSLAATFSGFLAGNAVTGIQLSSGIFMPLLGQITISPAAMHRIGCFAISILDTIPINAAVISGLATCGLTHKEGYGPIFRTTVLYIFFGMLAVIAMCVLFPSLCAA